MAPRQLHVLAPEWRYHSRVPSIQVKDVPDDVHRILRRRAAAAGQSLQEFLLVLLQNEARTPTLDEVFERIEHRTGGSVGLTTAAQLIRAERDARVIVVDASILAPALADDGGDGRRVREPACPRRAAERVPS